ncbi:MAG: type II toxin-antitoxin system RelE/ParE family toxin [Candidatus Pacearchaeota archaeon]
MRYTLKFGKRFDKEFSKLDKSISEQIVKKLRRIKENPESMGKPLFYTKPVLWEFKVKMFRVFYTIKKNSGEIWLLSIKHKNETDSYIKKGYLRDVNES